LATYEALSSSAGM